MKSETIILILKIIGGVVMWVFSVWIYGIIRDEIGRHKRGGGR